MERFAFIDNTPFNISDGETILDFVRRHKGFDIIPTLCQAENLENYGSCRLCSVEVSMKENGPARVMASCHTPVAEGYYIYPSTGRIKKLRKNILELVLSDYPQDRIHPEDGHLPTEFQKVLSSVGIPDVRYRPHNRQAESTIDSSHPYIMSDLTECIKCYRCVRACDELQAGHILGVMGRGNESRIIKCHDESFVDSSCVSCGACVQTCPTNAIFDRYRTKTLVADKIIRTICTYCGVGCNLEVKVINGVVRGIQSPANAEVNRGHTCVKGRYAFEFYNHPDRLRSPMIRKDGVHKEVSWEEAYAFAASGFKEIKAKYGPDRLA
jgi:formate dehydrogenase major subunit